MPDHKKKKKTLARVLKGLLWLILIGVIGAAAWMYLIPMITADSVTVYDSYTVGSGDINTTRSFSATLSTKKSETFSATEECTVRELYVDSGDEVKQGDALVLLSTGDLFSANFDGVVNEIRVKKGDTVWHNFSVVQVSDLEHLEVSMNVDEYDVEELSIGQACTVRVISLGIDFDTVIAHINRVSQSPGTVAYYSVTCDLTVPENVLPGMQATVTLPSTSVTGVTTLDMGALAFDEDQKPYVLVKQLDGTYVKNEVETGLTDGMLIEITGGLTPGQTVYAAAGTESVTSTVTLSDLYQMLVGKKVVINDMSSGGRGGDMPQMSGDMPQMSGDMPQMDGSATQTAGTQTGDALTTDGTQVQTTGEPTATNAPDGSGTAGDTATDATSAATMSQGGPAGTTGDAASTAGNTATTTQSPTSTQEE